MQIEICFPDLRKNCKLLLGSCCELTAEHVSKHIERASLLKTPARRLILLLYTFFFTGFPDFCFMYST